MVEGIVPTRLRDGDREHDIRVRLAPEYRNNPDAVLQTPLYSPGGAAVRTSDVVQFGPEVGPSNIDREQRRKQAKIGIDLAPRYALGDVTAEVEKAVASVQMPATFEWGFAGDVELMQESAAAMGLAMILAVAFIYIVLASQFESFLQPFIIMLSLPLALVGALLLLLATGKNLGMPAMIGVVMLYGMLPTIFARAGSASSDAMSVSSTSWWTTRTSVRPAYSCSSAAARSSASSTSTRRRTFPAR
jgi:HAE1 family hydrophobic/amphiphilic exporter-1